MTNVTNVTNETYKKDQLVEMIWEEKWYRGKVKKCYKKNNTYTVDYPDFEGDESEPSGLLTEKVGVDRLRPVTGYEANTHVQVMYYGNWCDAQIQAYHSKEDDLDLKYTTFENHIEYGVNPYRVRFNK